MFYRIEVMTGGTRTYQYVKAESQEEAKKELEAMIADCKAEQDDASSIEEMFSSIKEVKIEECIEEEEETRELELENHYLKLNYDFDKLTIREYSRIMKSMKTDPETKWLMLKEYNDLQRQYAFLRKVCDLSKMSVAEYDELAKTMLKAVGTEKYEAVVKSVCQKYGKEAFSIQAADLQ